MPLLMRCRLGLADLDEFRSIPHIHDILFLCLVIGGDKSGYELLHVHKE